LPENADPIALLAAGDEVWVSDWNNDVVRRFTTNGERLPNLESAGLEAILVESRRERLTYTFLSYAGIALFAFVLLGLFVRAYAVGMNKGASQEAANDASAVAVEDTTSLHLKPDEKARQRMSRALWIIAVLSFLIVVPLIFIFGIFDHPEIMISLAAPVAGIFAIVVLIAWVNSANWGTAILVDGRTLTLRDHTGRQTSCSISEARFDNTAIATRDAVVMLGRPQAPIYDREDVEERLLPRLGDAQRINAVEMLWMQIQLRHPQGLVTVIAIVGILVYFAVTMAS